MTRSGRVLAALLAVGLLSAACAGARNEPTADPAPSTARRDATATTRAKSGGLARQYGVRYCEMLTVTVGDAATNAEVWGTQGLNDCPQAAFEAIDPAAVRQELGVTVAVPNGPRYWVLDDIVANQIAGSGQVRNFGDVAMRSIATIAFGKGLPDRSPYHPISVKRDTEFRFDAGRTIYELTAPDGAIYVMQSYSQEVDPSLDAGALAGLSTRLALPAGWTFTARALAEPLVVEDTGGTATVIQDDLHNTYQRRG